jgi:hypothetical protein
MWRLCPDTHSHPHLQDQKQQLLLLLLLLMGLHQLSFSSSPFRINPLKVETDVFVWAVTIV